MLRDGGFDLAKSGLDLSDYRFRDELPRPDGVTVVDAAFLAAAEQLAGELRLYPKDNYARRLLRPAVEVLPQLPAGLCARLGLALHGAGDHTAARACRERLQNAALPALTPDRFPGEDPLAVMALRLELDVALQAPAAECERAAAELLLAGLRGGSTYGRSCALAALALVLPRTEAAPGSVVVAAGGERRELAIGGEAGAAVRCALPRAAAVTVRGPAGMPLLVRVVAQRAERASDHPAWASPVRVERQWCTVRADATYEDRRDGRDLVPLAGAPLVGRPLVLRLVVQSPVPMRHVVVDCPLPAGFELPGEPKGIERFDDRVAFACNLDPRWPTVLRLDVVPTVAGRFVWPPATAAPMYVSGNDGGAAGTFVDVAAVPPGAVPSLATCLTGPRPAKLDEPPDPFEDLCDELEDLLEEDPIDGVDEAARQRAADTKLGELAQLKADPWHALGLTTQLIRHVDSSDGWLLAEHAWRFAAVVRLRAALVDRTIAALEVPWSADREVAQRGAQMLLEALAEWPADSAREPWISRWWPKARAVGIAPDDLLGLLSREPEDPALCTALRELVATGKRQQARGAWALLSAEQRQMLSPTVVLDKLGADHEGIIAWLTASDAGRAELRSRLRTPSSCGARSRSCSPPCPGPCGPTYHSLPTKRSPSSRRRTRTGRRWPTSRRVSQRRLPRPASCSARSWPRRLRLGGSCWP
jgi:hypothetical protein